MKKKAFSLVELSIVILVIGLLVAGVTQGSKLLRKFNLVAAQNKSKKSPVNIIKGLTVWLDATSASSLDLANLSDGDSISNWNDVTPIKTSNQKINLVDAGNKPVLDVSGINGLPSIYFNDSSGSQHLQRLNTKGNEIFSQDEITMFLVQKYIGGSAAFNVLWHPEAGGNTRFSIHALWWRDRSVYFDFSNICCSNGRISTSAYNSQIAEKEVILTFHKKGNNAYVNLNGSTIVQSINKPGKITSQAAGPFRVGVNMIGYIGELIIFKKGLSAGEVSKIEKYLSDKWGIALSN